MPRWLLATFLTAVTPLAAALAAGADLQAGAPLTGEFIAELVRSELAERGMDGTIDVEVREPAAAMPNRAAATMRVSLVELRLDGSGDRFRGRLEAVLPSGESAEITTTGRIDQLVEIAVPAHAIPRGQTIAEDDVALVRIPASTLPAGTARDRDDLIGRQAVRVLAAHRPARTDDLAAPWLVRRGDEASTVFRRTGLEIVSATEALDNGRHGDSIRVRNVTSGEIRRAVVVGDRRVEVTDSRP